MFVDTHRNNLIQMSPVVTPQRKKYYTHNPYRRHACSETALSAKQAFFTATEDDSNECIAAALDIHVQHQRCAFRRDSNAANNNDSFCQSGPGSGTYSPSSSSSVLAHHGAVLVAGGGAEAAAPGASMSAPLSSTSSSSGDNEHASHHQLPSRVAAMIVAAPPQSRTLHVTLIGKVSFVPYPTEAYTPAVDPHPGGEICRLFIGQAPYMTTTQQLAWIFDVCCPGTVLYEPERITKKSRTGGTLRVPTGCIHANIKQSQLDAAVAALNKRVLIDDSGIWYAATSDEQGALDAYVAAMKADARLRPCKDRPYDSLVVQAAVSTFQPRAPRWLTDQPEMERFAPSLPPRHKSPSTSTPHSSSLSSSPRSRSPQQPHLTPSAVRGGSGDGAATDAHAYYAAAQQQNPAVHYPQFAFRGW